MHGPGETGMALRVKAIPKTRDMGRRAPDNLNRIKSFTHLPVQLHGQDRVGVAVIADLSSFLKVANFQLPRGFEADDGHQAA